MTPDPWVPHDPGSGPAEAHTPQSRQPVQQSVYERLVAVSAEKGAGFIVLLDPDRIEEKDVPAFVGMCEDCLLYTSDAADE